jgi:hypothetical protein
MKYTKIKLLNPSPNEPVWIYEELDDDRWELRKVEIFLDGRIARVSELEESDETGLSIERIPPLSEIAADPHFEAHEITAEEFEEVWSEGDAAS